MSETITTKLPEQMNPQELEAAITAEEEHFIGANGATPLQQEERRRFDTSHSRRQLQDKIDRKAAADRDTAARQLAENDPARLEQVKAEGQRAAQAYDLAKTALSFLKNTDSEATSPYLEKNKEGHTIRVTSPDNVTVLHASGSVKKSTKGEHVITKRTTSKFGQTHVIRRDRDTGEVLYERTVGDPNLSAKLKEIAANEVGTRAKQQVAETANTFADQVDKNSTK